MDELLFHFYYIVDIWMAFMMFILICLKLFILMDCVIISVLHFWITFPCISVMRATFFKESIINIESSFLPFVFPSIVLLGISSFSFNDIVLLPIRLLCLVIIILWLTILFDQFTLLVEAFFIMLIFNTSCLSQWLVFLFS